MTVLKFFVGIFFVATTVSSSNLQCAVCGRKSSKTFLGVKNFVKDMKACFGHDFEDTGLLCSACLRALYRHRHTGETYEHVSLIS